MVPDYYQMLGVDASADKPIVEAALAKAQPAWSSGTRNPKHKHVYQSYLDQIPALKQALLGDPSARAAYDAELFAARRAERDARLDALQRLLKLRAAKGGLTVTDRAILRDEATRLGLAAEDLDRLAEPIPPRPEAPAAPEDVDPPADVVDPATRRQVRLALDHLRRRDLYDVLELPRDAPAAEIGSRADDLRRRWMQKAQVTAEKTAWLEAVSYAHSHLGSAEARARYDRTLVVEAEEALGEAVRFAVKGTRQIDPGTRRALRDEGAGLGILPDRAERLIDRACRAQGVSREEGTTEGASPSRFLRCPRCGGVTDFLGAAKSPAESGCRHCGGPLRWDCPACQRAHWVDQARCACGFRREDREPLVRHFEAAQHAHKTRNYVEALRHLEVVQGYAPRHVGARKGVSTIRETMAEVERARATVEAERARGHLVAARGAVDAWARLVDPTDPELRSAWAEVSKRLRDAHALAARGKAASAVDPAAARTLLREALAIAADLPEAKDGLRRMPPDPPRDLVAAVEGGKVRLRWSPPPPDGLGATTYRVVRKPLAVPAHPADGVAVAEVPGTRAEDADAPAGEAVGYAVFTRRGEVESASGAGFGPILVRAEVADVRVEATGREVDIAWSTPAAAADVVVTRTPDAPPTASAAGEVVPSLRDRLHDRGVEEDRVYHYRIRARYKGVDGRLVASDGVVVAAMPHRPAEPPGDLTLSVEPDGGVRLAWPEPPRGQVRVLRTARPPALTRGDRLAAAAAEALEGPWLDPTGPGRAIDRRPPASGVCAYTPFTVWGGWYTAGSPSAYSCVPDPSDLRAVRVGGAGRVHLRWRWSPQGSQSVVAARAGAPPTGPDDPGALRAVVNDAEYSRLGYHALTLPTSPPGPWHLAVYSLTGVDGSTVASPGLEPSAHTVVPGPHPEITVSYTLRPPGFGGRTWSVGLRTDPPGASTPPLALVAHARAVPLSAEDGEVVAHFPAAADGSTFRFRARAEFAGQQARLFVDPRAAPDGVAPIRLRHPEARGTRV